MFTQIQFDAFLKELNYAYSNVSFYRKHLEHNGITPEDILFVEDVKDIPYTEKKDYRKNFPIGVVAKGFSLSDESLVRSQSSGTTGERLITYEVGMLLLARAIECTRVNRNVEQAFTRSPRKICRYAAPNCSDVECANPNSTREDRILSDGTLVLPVYHDLLTTSEELLDRALDEICDYQPDLYYVDPTHFAFLLRHARKKKINLPNAPVVMTYTATHALNRHQIVDAFEEFGYRDIVLAELVSSSEMGWLALECAHGALHLNSQAYFMEIVRGDRYAYPGETGELYITSLDGGAIPHIRYKTGDVFRYRGNQCSCGSPLPIVSMEGRVGSLIRTGNGALFSAADICEAIGAPRWLDLFQVVQKAPDKFSLLTIANDCYQNRAEREVIDNLHRLFGDSIQVVHENVSYIATERSGKFQCVKSEVSDSWDGEF